MRHPFSSLVNFLRSPFESIPSLSSMSNKFSSKFFLEKGRISSLLLSTRQIFRVFDK